MIRQAPHIAAFQQQMQESLLQGATDSYTITLAKGKNVYVCGDQDGTVFFIKSGQVKLTMVSATGRECLLAILVAGDTFGELCLSGLGMRQETATAMTKTVLKPIPCPQFLECLSRDSLLEGFVQYLAVRVADQQALIASLMTADSEQRLGKILLDLARKLGKQDPRSIRIEQRITHDELAAMVGTTRPRISEFMCRFRERGLIEISAERFLIVKKEKLTSYLAQSSRSSVNGENPLGKISSGVQD